MASDGVSSKPRRLNPFALPAETDVRFLLLIFAICMFAVNLGLSITGIYAPELNPAAIFQQNPSYPSEGDPDYSEKLIDGLLQRSNQALKSLGIHIGLVAILLIVSGIVFLGHPILLRFKMGLTPLSQSKDSTFQVEVEQLVELSGVSPSPGFELGGKFQEQNGQAFGFHNQYAVRLGRGLRLLLRKEPGRFRAIVLHELAHIVNKDIGRAYFAQSLWLTAVILILAPLGFGLLGFSEYAQNQPGMSLVSPIIFILQVIGTLGVVALIRASLLRTRELYADWRAAAWGAKDALVETFQESISNKASFPRSIFNPWRLHPASQERLDSLRSPGRLFTVTPDLPFLTGLVLAFLVGGLVNVVLPLILVFGRIGLTSAPLAGPAGEVLTYTATLIGMAIPLVLSLFLAGYLISETLGLQIQREAIAEMEGKQFGFGGYLKLWIPATMMVLGMETGFYLTPFSPDTPWLALGADWSTALPTLPWIFGSVILIWFSLASIRFFAKRVLGSHTGQMLSPRTRRPMVVISSALLSALYFPILGARIIISQLGMNTVPGIKPLPSEQVEFLEGSIPAILMFGFALFVFIFCTTGLVLATDRVLRKNRCPSCRQFTHQRHSVGQVCEHCGNDLAPWLYITFPSGNHSKA